MITYRATLDLPAETVRQVAGWLSAHRKAHDRAPWQRAATPFVQAVMTLRWFKDNTDIRLLARDAGVSIATATGICTRPSTSSPRTHPTCATSSPQRGGRGRRSCAWTAP